MAFLTSGMGISGERKSWIEKKVQNANEVGLLEWLSEELA